MAASCLTDPVSVVMEQTTQLSDALFYFLNCQMLMRMHNFMKLCNVNSLDVTEGLPENRLSFAGCQPY